MGPVIKFFNTRRGILEFGPGDQNVEQRAGCPGMCEWHVNILEFDPGISEFGLGLRGWNEAGN